MKQISADINGGKINIYIGSGLEDYINNNIYGRNVSFVSKSLSGYRNKLKKIKSIKIYMHDGESIKDLRYLRFIVKKLIDLNIERSDTVSYIGGGTVGDLTGFASSVYKRGINLVAVPTTLLAQVDSSIGGKNAINFSGIKNVIGTFYNPKYIFNDTDFLLNSDKSLLNDGMAEIIKMAIINDENFYNYLRNNNIDTIFNQNDLENIIYKSNKIKLNIVSRDFFDKNKIRYLLNFGHTVGHAIESFTSNDVSHGTAIANGMLAENYIAYKMGLSENFYDEIITILENYRIPLLNFKNFDPDIIIKYILNDKKMESGKINLIVLDRIGKSHTEAVEVSEIKRYFSEFLEVKK